jgi:hypothetical protein
MPTSDEPTLEPTLDEPTLGKPEKSSVELKMPNDAPTCQRPSPSSSRQVVAIPVGPTGGERPQARASRG